MIDVDFSKIEEQEFGTLPILILEDSNVDCYCTIDKDYASIIQQIHGPTFNLDYRTIYKQLGCRGFKKYLYEYLEKNNIRIIYFRNMPVSEMDLNFIERLRKDYFIFNYFGDVPEHFHNSYRYLSQALDLILVDDYYDKFEFMIYGIESLLLPAAMDAQVYVPLGIGNKKYDVSFVGRLDRVGRKEFIAFLKQNGIKVEVFGWGSKNGVVDKKEMIEIFNNSKINLNFSGISEVFKNKIESRIKQLKGHCQEIALTKSFVLTEYSLIINRIFEIGSEIDVFYDKNDLLEKVNLYLKNEEKRKQMAQNAYERALKDYDSRRLWKRLLQLIYYRAKNKKYRNSNVIIDNYFLEAICLSRIRYILYFMRCFKFHLVWEEISASIKSRSIFLIPVVIIKQIVMILRKLSRRFKKILGLTGRPSKI